MQKIHKIILLGIALFFIILYVAFSQRWIASKWFLPSCQSDEVLNLLSNDFLNKFKLDSNHLIIKYEFITEEIDENVKNERACSANITYQFTNSALLEVQRISESLTNFGKNFGSVSTEKLSPAVPKIKYTVKVDLSTSKWFIEFTKFHVDGNYQIGLVSRAINDGESIIQKASYEFAEKQKRKAEAEERERARVEENERRRIENEKRKVELERARAEEKERFDKRRAELERSRAEENERRRIENEQRLEKIKKQREIKTFN